MLSTPVIIGLVVAFAVVAAAAITMLRSSTAEHQSTPDNDRGESQFDVQELARRLQVPLETLEALTPQYSTRQITKPRGGIRRLEIPDAETTQLQRTILRRLLGRLEAHPFACGFEPGASIVDAALPHVGRQVVVKLDVRRFFESTTADRLQTYFRNIGWDDEATALLVRLTTHDGHLPQGAPTSPRLSNLVNAPLDEALLRLSRKHNGSYSRYADDITLSFDYRRGVAVRGVIQAARRILRSYGYTMHGGKKLKVLRQHQQQKVLGLVVNSQVNLPRKTRRWLRSVRHRVQNGLPVTLTPEQLHGWEAFEAMVQSQSRE